MVVDAAWELYAEQYQGGVSLDEIAKRSGLSRHAVTAQMKRLGVYQEGRRNTNTSLSKCKRGHDMAVYGRQLFTSDGKKNGRECRECKRLRQRVTHSN